MMPCMNMHLTEEQYWHLLRATYIADWMANAVCEDEKEGDKGIARIFDHILSLAKEAGFADFVKYEEERGKYRPSKELEDAPAIQEVIDHYDDHAMWDGLVDLLAERDFQKKYTVEEIKGMDEDEHFEKLAAYEAVWEEEFGICGVDRLEIRGK